APSGNRGGVNYRSPTRFTVNLPKDYQVSVLRWAEPQSSAVEISNKTKTNGDNYIDASITCDYCGQGGSWVSTNLLVIGVKDKFIPPEVINYSVYPNPTMAPNTEAVVCNTSNPAQTVTFYGVYRDLNGSWYPANEVINHGFEDGWVNWGEWNGVPSTDGFSWI
ncbi:MAG: hypothetical protein RBT75_00990, partial [Anaerolineae bacterium]|nr:hypothetical protein [Anaerolineae bacterium]